jgi:exo-beta-1,3-glucanase (GH17 family)
MATPNTRHYSNLFHIVVVLFALSAITLGGWALLNRPDREVPPWPAEVSGYAYSPFRADQSPIRNINPTVDQIDEDLRLLATHTKHIRTYSVKDVQAEIPRLAKQYGISVTIGGWLTDQREANLVELNRLIEVVNRNDNIDRIIVGNETLLREELTGEDLIAYINYVRQGLNRKIPISTADSWDFWLIEKDLAQSVDFLGAHFLPYWLGKGLDYANADVVASYNRLQQEYKEKPILIAEVGWPSRGRERGEAEASNADEGKFLRKFLTIAEKNGYDYFIMEAFDQPWKMTSEGSVGAYWGVWDANRNLKFPLKGPVRPIPEWQTLVTITIALAVLTFLALLVDAKLLRRRAVSFLAVVAFVSTSALVWIAYQMMDPYATTSTIVLGVILAVSAIGVITVLLVEAHEWAEAVWSLRRRRPFGKAERLEDGREMKVSVHVPCYNEPPEMVIETIEALRKLNYQNYEVLIIDKQHQGRSGVETGRGILRKTRRSALPLLPRRSDRRLQGRRPELRHQPHRGRCRSHRRHRQRLPGSARTGSAIWYPISAIRKLRSCRRRRIIATATKTCSSACATPNTRAFSISAWSPATIATPLSSTAP